jgi:fucose permease
MLFAFFGSILPSWGHHLRADYSTVGGLFFCASIGIVVSARLGAWLLKSRGTGTTLVIACSLATGALLYLAAMSPPAPAWSRMIGFALVGTAGGLLQAGIFQAIGRIYKYDSTATINIGGTLFGLGCVTVALLISGTFYVYTVPSILVLLAVVPGLFSVAYSKIHYPPVTSEYHRPLREMLGDLRSPTAVLFALLLFFQFGNEWAIACWLPLFLAQRLGISPAKSLMLLAVYWLSLMVGRVVVQSLQHLRHTYVLLVSILSAMFGCLMLALTNTPFGALTGVILVGAGFAPIYPLVVERIGSQFPNYHPGFYNGIFTLALTGGFLAPCALGYFAEWSGVQIVMLLPFVGSVMVFLLLIAIWVGQRVEHHGNRSEPSPIAPS